MSEFPRQRTTSRHGRGFSLIEILAVLAIAMLLLGLAAPSFLTLSPARRGAALELQLFLEEARSTAIKEEALVFVAFADGASPAPAAERHRLYAAFREARDQTTESGEDPREDEAAGQRLLSLPVEPVTPWQRLPQGLVLATGADFETLPGETFATVMDSPWRRLFPWRSGTGDRQAALPFLAFGPRGEIAWPPPAGARYLHCGVAEGYSDESGTRVLTARRPGRQGSGSFAQAEAISLNRYTGKARLTQD